MFTVLQILAGLCVGALTETPRYALEDAPYYFDEFVIKYGKHYSTKHERDHRFEIFKANLEQINQMNMEDDDVVFGINHFTDLTKKEFAKMYTGLRSYTEEDDFCDKLYDDDILDVNATESFDWREKNAVTRVKNQRNCGSCWAFSAVGLLEGLHAIKTGYLVELSEQQVINCDKWSDGCCGGSIPSAIKSVINTEGIMEEEGNWYLGDKDTCEVQEKEIVAKVKKCISLSIKSQEKVKQLLFKNGPIAIGIRSEALQGYETGIIRGYKCSEGVLDHAVLLVGYGVENGVPYWIVKNSWGPAWGEGGYFRMTRGENMDSCGMMNDLMTTAELE